MSKEVKDLAIIEKEQQEVMTTAEKFLSLSGTGDKLTPMEKEQFYQLCKAFHLNPYKREIYAIVYGKGERRKCNIVIGYEVFLKLGNRSGRINGWKAWTEGELNKEAANKSTLKACIEIHRKDWKMPFYHEVFFSEYYGTHWDYDLNKAVLNEIWNNKPITMIKKVVIGQGFRLCVPEDLEGVPYLEEELYDRVYIETKKDKILTTGQQLAVPEELQKQIEAKNQSETIQSAADMANGILRDAAKVSTLLNPDAEFVLSGEMTEGEKAQAIKDEIEQAKKNIE
jgi:phage recombination protein Bet